MAELITKDDLLNKLRAYCETPDDETIRYKNKIKNALLYCPELLYAMDENGINILVTQQISVLRFLFLIRRQK